MVYLGNVVHEKYRGWYSSTVAFSSWADYAQPSAGIKKAKKHVQSCYFHCFLWILNKKCWRWWFQSIFSWISHHFDTQFAFVGVQNKKITNFYLACSSVIWSINSNVLVSNKQAGLKSYKLCQIQKLTAKFIVTESKYYLCPFNKLPLLLIELEIKPCGLKF